MLWDTLLEKPLTKSGKKDYGQLMGFIEKNKKGIDKALKIVRADAQGLVSQKQFDDFYNRIHRKVEKLHKLKKEITAQLEAAEKIEEAEKIRRENMLHFENRMADFEFLRQKLKSEIRKSDEYKNHQHQKTELLDQVAFDFQFDDLNPETIHAEQSKIDVAFEKARQSMGEVLASGQNVSGNTARQTKVSLQTVEDKSEADDSALIQKMELLLSKIQRPASIKNFKNRLMKYQQRSGNIHYYLVELYDDIRLEISDQQNRSELLELEKSLKNQAFHPQLENEIRQTEAQTRKALQRDKIKNDDVLQIKNLMDHLDEKNRILQREDLVAAREREYIKSGLLHVLSEMNYEVARDTQVIDFESENDFLLSIPGQDNFLNLRFDDEGRMLYNFLIPENKTDLSMDEQSVKLSEMEETCNQFRNVLQDLKKQGLDIELQHEIEISEKALVRVPSRHADVLSGIQKKQKQSKSSPARQKKRKGL